MFKRNPYSVLEKRLGYRFRNKNLLVAALTHRSFRFENREIDEDNQRLEFLGDAVLGYVAAGYLYEEFCDKNEGVLTSHRSRITSGKALASIAKGIGLGEYVKVGHGEEMSGGRDRASNLEDALESVIGAACLDGDIKAVQKIFKELFVPCIESLSEDVWEDNPKGKLQEHSQKLWKTSPRYRVTETEGPAHAAIFRVEVILTDGTCGRGEGSSKQAAERVAAHEALGKLNY
ncbi:MAG: ribonuclease III [Kiritimatiellae bacterium]|nr:ribonuclease III [Kiritimatiellia bacterium]